MRKTLLQRRRCRVEDAWQTMALVDAAYASSASPATPMAELPS